MSAGSLDMFLRENRKISERRGNYTNEPEELRKQIYLSDNLRWYRIKYGFFEHIIAIVRDKNNKNSASAYSSF